MDIVLRKVGLEDLDLLHGIAVDTFAISFAHLNNPEDFDAYVDEKLSASQLKDELNNDDSLFYFVWIEKEVKGYLKVNRLGAQTEQNISNALEIERIYLLPDTQGFGIGKLMLDKAEEIAIEEKYESLWLGVWEKNQGAISFYKREGFKVVGRHTFMLGTDAQVDLMMKKDLSN